MRTIRFLCPSYRCALVGSGTAFSASICKFACRMARICRELIRFAGSDELLGCDALGGHC